jgi:phenylalanyl-tRNA synthetase beta chain
VCGAPNVAKGQKVAVVKVGTTLPGGLEVKKATLRGAPSHGMICSEQELGLSEEHDGILVLDASAKIGTSLLDALSLDDEILDISITPNRGDCLSVLGIAREVAAVTGLPLTLPRFERHTSDPDTADASGLLAIEIADPELCPLYHGMILEGTAAGSAPGWMRYRLHSVGVRSISNLVDATNYILMELGQPLHAFDLDAIRGGRIIVRGADQGERFTTLDGQERALTPADITIRDAEGIIAVGGVMGGLDSEITKQSSRVFLESAIFNPSNIRKTSKRLGIPSEAAYRFERGVDQVGATFALERAAHLMAEISGGVARPGLLKVEPKPWTSPILRLRRQRAEDLLGIPLEQSFCENTLTSLGCEVHDHGKLRNGESTCPIEWSVTPPSWRRDLTREADLIEEIIRIYGVDRVPPILPVISHSLERAGQPETRHAFLHRIKHWGKGAGLNESVTYSFVAQRDLDLLGISAKGRIPILNPLSDDLNVLRPHLAPGLFAALRNNLAQGAASVRLFEVAAAFTADAASDTTAHEQARLGIVLHGSRYDQAWPREAADLDYVDLKGLVEHLLAAFALPAGEYGIAENPMPWLTPCVSIAVRGKNIGFAGRVKPDMADHFHAKKPVWTAEIDLDALFALHREAEVRFAPLPTFPPVRRDITFIAPVSVTAQAISTAIEQQDIPLLAEVRLIDCFEPKDKNDRNLTYRLTFRHAERTLKDSEADKQRDAVVSGVQKILPVRI